MAHATYETYVDGKLVTIMDDGGGMGEGVTLEKDKTYDDVRVIFTEGSTTTTNETTTAVNVGHGGTSTITGQFMVVNAVPLDERTSSGFITSLNNNALFAQSGSTVNINSGSNPVFIAALSDSKQDYYSAALSAKNTDNSGDQKHSNYINVSGNNVKIIGDLDIYNSNYHHITEMLTVGNYINVSLSSSKSFWYGDQSALSSSNLGSIHLTLSDGAQWVYRENGILDVLTLNEKGIVNLADKDIEKAFSSPIEVPEYVDEGESLPDGIAKLETINLENYCYSPTMPHVSLKIEQLNGSGGIFKMDLIHQGNERTEYFNYNSESEDPEAYSDYIIVTDEADAGVHTVDFDDEVAEIYDLKIGDKIYFAKLPEASETVFKTNHDGLAYRADEPVDFVYATDRENVNDSSYAQNGTYWYFTHKGNATGAYQPFMKAAAFASFALATDLDRLNDRRGESRYIDGSNNGLWVRYTYTNLDRDDAFEMDKNMIQLGYDRVVSEQYGKLITPMPISISRASRVITRVSAMR